MQFMSIVTINASGSSFVETCLPSRILPGPSFKVALGITPEQAIAFAGELLTAATRKSTIPIATAGKQVTKPKASIQIVR
jgi:hypothetical protein